MPLLSLDTSGRGEEKQRRGGKLRISQARDSFQDHAVRVRKAAPGSQQRRMKFRCWQVISSRAVHTLPASGCLCPRSSITSTSSCKGTSLGLLERSGGWKAPEVGSILVSVIYRIQRSSRHCKTWQQGNQSPASCSSPVLGTKLPITARPRHDNADILPLETRAGCGLELQHDAPGPGEEGKGQLAGMKTKQQQIKISTPQTKSKKLISTTKNTVPTGPGSCQLWQWIK